MLQDATNLSGVLLIFMVVSEGREREEEALQASLALSTRLWTQGLCALLTEIDSEIGDYLGIL